MLVGEGIQPITYFVELLSFLQDGTRKHGKPAFLRA